jgi:hypothetical protein
LADAHLIAGEIEDTAAELSSDECASRKDVEENLNQLTRLTVAIRKAGTRFRLQKADSSFNPDDPQLILLSRHLEILLRCVLMSMEAQIHMGSNWVWHE